MFKSSFAVACSSIRSITQHGIASLAVTTGVMLLMKRSTSSIFMPVRSPFSYLNLDKSV